MDLRDRIEIYIPAEAEVKSIPLWSLPNSVLRRMGLPLSDSNGSKKLTNSPKGVWICPAVIRRKGQKPGPHTGHGVMENALSLLGRECRATSGPFRMSFTFSNRTAYKVLKDTMPGNKLSTLMSHTSLPQGPAPRIYQTAVIIYAGHIYLSVRKASRGQGQCELPQPASLPVLTVRGQFKSQKQKLLNDKEKPKKKPTTCKVTRGSNKKGVTHKVREVSSSMAARSAPQSTVGVHRVDSHRHEDARAEKTAEEGAVQEPDWFQPQEEQEDVANRDAGEHVMQDLGSEEAESINQNNDVDSNIQIDSGEVDQSSTQSWTRREPLGAACASTSLQNEFDFKELAEEEMIARMKARLKHTASFIMTAQSE